MPAEHVGRSAAVPDRVTLGSLRIPDLVAKLGGKGGVLRLVLPLTMDRNTLPAASTVSHENSWFSECLWAPYLNTPPRNASLPQDCWSHCARN
jgi:hypothetical protein